MTKEEIQIAQAAYCVGKMWDEYEGTDDFERLVGKRVRHLIELVRKSQPSLPTNLDEAAEISDLEAKNLADDYTKFLAAGLTNNESRPIGPQWMKKLALDRFKAGAEWMAGQGVIKETQVYANRWTDVDEVIVNLGQGECGFKAGDKVIVQIRRKQ